MGFPHSLVGKESACNSNWRPQFDSWVGKIRWRRDRLPLQYSWASLVAQLVKNLPTMLETWARSLSWEDPLEKVKGYPLRYSVLENSMNCIAHGVAKNWT